MTIYLKDQNKVVTLNARETAPAAASPNMYGGNSSASARGTLSDLNSSMKDDCKYLSFPVL